jgi:hypothetical protein
MKRIAPKGLAKKSPTGQAIPVTCPVHPDTTLVCPRCIATKGGRRTAAKYGPEQMREWGKRGGRPLTLPGSKRTAPKNPPINLPMEAKKMPSGGER